jgi:hypothetical protein
VLEQEDELVSSEREQPQREERVEIEEGHEQVDLVMHDVSKKREGDNAESAAPAKKKQRRERSERTTWGLTVVRFLLLFLSLLLPSASSFPCKRRHNSVPSAFDCVN